jgi:DNA-(apurinic or apyrimidinic site) lyase (EC 4.2.99.18)/Formamidopyrimidine-DNA glycosylase (EC 3.2.2.23)
MPELPEVETVRRTLEQRVIGKRIAAVEVRWPKMVKKPQDASLFSQLMAGQQIHSVRRRGKYLLFILDDWTLLSHLRMEGKYGVYQKGDPVEAHTHIIFSFDDGTELRYRDVRKFGTLHLLRRGEEEAGPPLSELGPEPFSPEFNGVYLLQKLKNTSRSIKAALLDQRIVAGLGNIYVDEALFRAGIHPARPACSLSREEAEILQREIVATLAEAVEMGGSTVRSYVNAGGTIGLFQLELNVYAREGEPCKRCGTPIEKIRVAGRGTHFCPNCQKKKGVGK